MRTEVNYTEEVDDPVDSDGMWHFIWCIVVIYTLWSTNFFPCTGEVLGFENLVFSIFEFVHTLLENKKFKSTVKKALPELIYYIILYMQITEDQVCGRHECLLTCCSSSIVLFMFSISQIKVWTANPQQFVEDEDDDTFSYSVRISAQDLLLVRTQSISWQVLDCYILRVIFKVFSHPSGCCCWVSERERCGFSRGCDAAPSGGGASKKRWQWTLVKRFLVFQFLFICCIALITYHVQVEGAWSLYAGPGFGQNHHYRKCKERSCSVWYAWVPC